MFFVVCAKIVQIESRNAKLAWAVMPRCSLFSAKIVQIEGRNAKLAWAVMPRYRLFSAKIVQIGLKNNSICTFFDKPHLFMCAKLYKKVKITPSEYLT